MKLMIKLLVVSGLFLSVQVLAQPVSEGEQLAFERKCYACHHKTETLIGPPYLAIAARHQDNKEVMVDVLTEKIIRGGGGNWGNVPMVPNELVTEEEARILARWILDQN